MKKFSKKNQRELAIWAKGISIRLLPFFEKAHPADSRPRNAIKTLENWIKTGEFSMAVIRKASLDAHAAARKAKNNPAASFSARCAGQAVATAHVAQHSFGASYYALKIAVFKDSENSKPNLQKELKLQYKNFPKKLLKDWEKWQNHCIPNYLKPT